MRQDVTEFGRFYDSQLGHLARRIIRERARKLWPDVRGMRVLGLGYATPFLGPFRAEAERTIALMPASQGVRGWPRKDRNLTALAEEHHLPLADSSMDRVMLVHALETSEGIRRMLREVWRVLAPGGRLIVVATNRVSLWALREVTPFGHGTPFTHMQLERLLRDAAFAPEQWDRALCLLPLQWPIAVKYGLQTEAAGQRVWRPLAGVLIADAVKEAMTAIPAMAMRARAPVLVTATPQGAPVRPAA